MLTERLITNPKEWNSSIQRLPQAHVLQSWEWGAFKAKYGWTPTRLLFCEGNTPRGAALVLRRRLPRTPFGVLYVPKGPLVDYGDQELFRATCASLERIAREQRAIFVKIDPDIERANDREPAAVQQLIKQGWKMSREQIQFKNTVLLDLRPSEEELLSGMKAKTRYNIRLAIKHGVRIEEGTADDLHLFYEMYAETSARDGFVIRESAYYRDALGAFLEAGRARMFLARLGDETIAGLVLLTFGTRAWYFYGASRTSHRDTMPNHLLQWEAIRWAKAQGYQSYDFWGAPDKLDKQAPMYGVYRFKEGFGGRFTQHVGAYDYVVNAALYYLYSVARPHYLARLRAKHTIEGE